MCKSAGGSGHKEGGAVSYDELDAQAEASPPFAAFIDPASPDFMQPGDMPRRIADYCKRTGQKPPETRGAIMRCIFESLSFTYRRTKERIERLIGKKYPCIHLVGGGVKSPILCQMTADACGVPLLRTLSRPPPLATSAYAIVATGKPPFTLAAKGRNSPGGGRRAGGALIPHSRHRR